MVEQTPIDLFLMETCSWLVGMPFSPPACFQLCDIGPHETIVVENMAFKSSLYLEKSKRYGEFAIYLIIHMAAMLVFDFRWSMGVFHYLI